MVRFLLQTCLFGLRVLEPLHLGAAADDNDGGSSEGGSIRSFHIPATVAHLGPTVAGRTIIFAFAPAAQLVLGREFAGAWYASGAGT